MKGPGESSVDELLGSTAEEEELELEETQRQVTLDPSFDIWG